MLRAIALDPPVQAVVLSALVPMHPAGTVVMIERVTVNGKLVKSCGFDRFLPIEGNFSLTEETKINVKAQIRQKTAQVVFTRPQPAQL